MNKKIKHYILIGIGIVAILFGIRQLNIQSVSQYEREGEELAEQLQCNDSVTAVPDASVSGTAVHPDVTKKQTTPKPEKTPAPSKKKSSDTKKNASGNTTPGKKPAETKKTTAGKKTAGKKTGKKAAVKSPKKEKKTEASSAETSPAVTKSPGENTITCTIEIRADSLNQIRDTLNQSVLACLPEDGVILAKTKVTLKKNTTAYQALEQICKAKKIALDAEYTPVYGSYYVKGIGHLYEQDAGDMSGWLYQINGKAPDVGASAYSLEDGDTILWGYTCDGRSV
jgi:hypothetical protein